MESFVDLVSSTFQATVALLAVLGAGYAIGGENSKSLSVSLVFLGRALLLPALLVTAFATSSVLTFRHLLSCWPILVIASSTHLFSLVVSIGLCRLTSAPEWLVESMTFNNVSSWPLLLLFTLYHLTTSGETGALAHLRWRSMDTSAKVLERGTTYILLYLVVVELFRSIITLVLPRLFVTPVEKHIEAAEEEDEEEDDVSEQTPLIATAPVPKRSTTYLSYLSPILIAALVGLLLTIIPAVKSHVVGNEDTGLSWVWGSFGTGVGIIGAAFAAIELLGIGAGLRAGEKKSTSEEIVPPTLGVVLLLSIWRYIALPAATVAIVYGFRKLPTNVYLYDPVFSFILATSSLAPPTLPANLTPYRSSILLSTTVVSLISPVALAAAMAVSGRGVSFQTDFDLKATFMSALGGGLSGAAAMIIQVLALMPLRTVMNYQYRFGGSLKGATKTLYQDGGVKRYYAGLLAALFQGPLSRFGDTAANAGILALLSSLTWPVLVKTIAASACSAIFRMTLTPIDTLKTTQQTQGGVAGLALLRKRIKEMGIASLWYGALATAAATFVGHYPWFGTYNYLQDALPIAHNVWQRLARQAFIGFAASVVSDSASNSLRVVKTYRQVHEGDVGYMTAVKEVVARDGVLGLFGRGLPTRILTNGLQGILFSILWRRFQEIWAGK